MRIYVGREFVSFRATISALRRRSCDCDEGEVFDWVRHHIGRIRCWLLFWWTIIGVKDLYNGWDRTRLDYCDCFTRTLPQRLNGFVS